MELLMDGWSLSARDTVDTDTLASFDSFSSVIAPPSSDRRFATMDSLLAALWVSPQPLLVPRTWANGPRLRTASPYPSTQIYAKSAIAIAQLFATWVVYSHIRAESAR